MATSFPNEPPGISRRVKCFAGVGKWNAFPSPMRMRKGRGDECTAARAIGHSSGAHVAYLALCGTTTLPIGVAASSLGADPCSPPEAAT